jgi:LmbE family N-acetylglucosaminyl deacetylase
LHACAERLQTGEQVLVIAPHPDDAEIAAFGLYADMGATVVTITTGGGTDRFRDGENSNNVAAAIVARMRVWDSITVPQLGGVGQERAVNLCYSDGRLQRMQANPDCEIHGAGDETKHFHELRTMNRSPLVRDGAKCTWNSLICDLVHILETVKPTVIVTPHPWLDPHDDHLYSTAAVCEALRTAGSDEGRFYFYANHNRRSELWPFGPTGSGVALLPMLADDVVGCDGFYSHPLSPERQSEKFLALEAMHDLRDVSMPEPRPLRAHLRRIRSEAAAAVHGTGMPPTSYLRRAVRPDELFFTSSFVKGRELCERFSVSS